MKKLFLFAAAAAMMTACSETEVLENAASLSESNEAPVTFDVYTQRNVTRGGVAGTNDNENIGERGFGVFGYWTKGTEYSANATPNFMYNQKVTCDGTATADTEWSYEPVKYWPNEFGSAAISDEVDRVSFFAYAPWTEFEPTTGQVKVDESKFEEPADIPYPAELISDEEKAAFKEAYIEQAKQDWINLLQKKNIISVNKNTATGDPIIKYYVDTDPATSVDLLWGVAAEDAEDNYTPIGGDGANDVKVNPGKPFIDLTKPNNPIEDKLLFNLKHALAKIKVTIDYIADDFTPKTGNTLDEEDRVQINAEETRIFVRSFTMSGFATKGSLNLNNTVAGEPLWKDEDGVKELNFSKPVTFLDGRKDDHEGVKTGEVKSEDPQGLNPELIQKYAVMAKDEETGATIWPEDQNPGVQMDPVLLFGGKAEIADEEDGFFYVIPRNSGEPVDVTIAYDVETIDAALPGKLADDETHGISIPNIITKENIFEDLDIKAGYQYVVNIHLGMTSVKISATVTPWVDNDAVDVNLPSNQEPDERP